jgi:ATP-dependent Clp protease ATP-binding subunit ClpC
MFERYTEKSIKVIMLSQEESRRLGHNFVGTEQILLGLIGQGTGIAAKVLRSMGVNLKDARIEVEKIVGRGSGFVALEIPFTPGAKRVLEFAQAESEELGHNYIGTEHLLLGSIAETENKAVRVLETLGVDLTKIRPQVIRMLGEATEVVSASSSSPMTVQQVEMSFLLKSIETKAVAIDRAVDELKKDIAALRRCIT